MENFPKGINVNEDNSLSFGNYVTKHKIKINDFKDGEATYNLRTHNLVTRLEKNGEMLLEIVPGAHVANFTLSEAGGTFNISGNGSGQITLNLKPETIYKLSIDNDEPFKVATNMAGKLTFGVELAPALKKIEIKA